MTDDASGEKSATIYTEQLSGSTVQSECNASGNKLIKTEQLIRVGKDDPANPAFATLKPVVVRYGPRLCR
jgi:hypothetical protein